MITEENFNGFLAFVFFLAVPIAALLGVVVRARYRKAIAREMMLQAEISENIFDVPKSTSPNNTEVEFERVSSAQKSPLRIGLALRYLVSGVAFACVTVVILFVLDDIEFLPVRSSVVIASFTLPAALMAVYVSGLKWFWNVLLLTFWIFVLFIIVPQITDLIGVLVLPAVILSLIAGNPALRTTAIPLFLVAISLVVPFVFLLDLLYVIMVAGFFDHLLFVFPPFLVIIVYIAVSIAIALATGIVISLLALRFIAWTTTASSEFTMQHDLLWLFQTLWMIGLGWGAHGALTLLYFCAFAAYRITLRFLSPRSQATEINLLLRVFGRRQSQTSLARGLLLDWRGTGPVLLIGASDLATETLDAPELAAFLRRRLKDIFINTPEDLARAEKAGENRLSDGLFPMRDYYCRDNSWRPTILTLMSRAQRVLVDMRGFDEANAGIQFEIRALAERVPADRIIVLAEESSLAKVREVFSEAWSNAGAGMGRDLIRCMVEK